MKAYIIQLEAEKQVQDYKPDFNLILRYSQENDVLGIGIMSKGNEESDYVYRVFAPIMGINEDAGTGIVNCMIGHYWGEILNKKRMNVGQPSERFSEFQVELVENGVKITGKATPLIKGTLSI